MKANIRRPESETAAIKDGQETPLSFRQLFCRTHRCPISRFASSLFWRCLHRRAFLRSALVYAINPGYFALEFTLIHSLGDVTNYDDFNREIREYQRQLQFPEWASKASRRMRLSGDRLVKLGFEVFHKQRDQPARNVSKGPVLRFT